MYAGSDRMQAHRYDGHPSWFTPNSPLFGLTQKFCLVDAYIGGTFRKLSYRDEVRERNVIGN